MNEQLRRERETEAYKVFMRAAKKVVKADPSYRIVPNADEPYRLFTLEKDIGWCTLQVVCVPEVYKRRKVGSARDDYRFKIGFTGLYNDDSGGIILRSRLPVKPRITKKLLSVVKDKVIPGWYRDIERTTIEWEEQRRQKDEFENNVLSIKGMQVRRSHSDPDIHIGTFDKAPTMRFRLERNRVEVDGELSYPELQRLVMGMGWNQ